MLVGLVSVAGDTGTMPTDKRLRRAAGVILWSLTHGNDIASAVAKASAREPELTTVELQYATDWASAALRFQEMAAMAQKSTCMGELIAKSGLLPFIDQGQTDNALRSSTLPP